MAPAYHAAGLRPAARPRERQPGTTQAKAGPDWAWIRWRMSDWSDRPMPTSQRAGIGYWRRSSRLPCWRAVSIRFPHLLGNGPDVADLAFRGQVGPLLLVTLVVLRPAVTLLCLGSGAPGGLFTPTLTVGATVGGVLGLPWSWLWPGMPPGLFALLGAAAMLVATTQDPISATVLIMELTGYARAAIVPLLRFQRSLRSTI